MTTIDTDPREAFAERLIEDVTRSLETLSVYLGTKLGLYHALTDLGDANPAALADAAAIDARYAREWLEHQTSAGYLACDDLTAPADERRYRIPEAHAEVLTDADSPFHVAPAVRMLAGVTSVLPQVLDAYRTGGGVPYGDYGEDIRRGIAGINRPMFLHELPEWIAAVPEVDRRLRESTRPRILDLGCGCGHSTLELARAYPNAQVVGVDLDKDSIVEARAAANEADLTGRVSFTDADAAELATEQRFELVTMYETLHDMGDPAGVLRTARSLLSDGGAVLVGDERVADDLSADGDLLERFQFGWSVLHCLPATIAEDPVEANGTMLRAPTVARWAAEAGYADFEVAPIENDFWRFYLMRG
ncbi:class I SAM-dependent methyltransferase [Glycomyces xiaoerkulensis]|uniref:class I SAM-dependent methyltransferase n=1 Tax=Glycomyces xiaoerkulensis TaxID=2038139 RepID=UPI000C25E555|nr:class I SAM-dependent methyltransferase [Glycomyces xiaoerkulensis]